VSLLIRQNGLFAGVIPLGRTEVRLKDISCPLLNAFAEQDGITPAASSEPLARLVGSEDASELRPRSGPIGFIAGRQAARIAAADRGLDPAPRQRSLTHGRNWPRPGE
jgi:polyhydroxyalkanoate synthase subunit PhaC